MRTVAVAKVVKLGNVVPVVVAMDVALIQITVAEITKNLFLKFPH